MGQKVPNRRRLWLAAVVSLGLFSVHEGEAKSLPQRKPLETIEILPGLSLGPVKIGDTAEELRARGFVDDPVREKGMFLQKDELLVRLDNGAAVQIWFDSNDFSKVRYGGRKLSGKPTLAKLKKFFSGCEPEVRGSGGLLVFCENRGIQLTTSYLRGLDGFSVTTPQNAAKVLGPGH